VTRGYADTRPLVPNTSPENMYRNRRTELKILE
jgi:flagellar motor protein MotB